jgi:AmpE protein
MSLISLLLALAAERYLSTSLWQFNEYYQRYQKLFERLKLARNSIFSHVLFIIVPVLICYFLLSVVSDGLLHFVISTLVLIVCFGCVSSRELYKKYLMSAFRGETEQCEGYYRQLLADKNLPDLGFGQSLIWLNYRYFIAIMLFFMVFGAPGALCYRLLTKINEDTAQETQETQETQGTQETQETQGTDSSQQLSTDPIEQYSNRIELAQQILFWLDWLPSRIVAFGYMLVGHFSKALPVWLENLFEFNKSPQTVLVTVAEKSEDFMIDDDDCTAEPCLLVRLAKRTLLLCLAFIAILILTGIIN